VNAPSGQSGSCFGGCKFVAHVPVVLPALGVLTTSQVTLPLECTVRCKGSGTLELLTASGGASTVLAHFKFNLGAKAITSLSVTLSRAAQKRFAHKKTVTIGFAVTLKGPSVHGSYASTVTITRGKPPTQH
jgi:hypothetical protein